MSRSSHKLYRIPSRGKVKGVCAGIADYLGVPVRLVRAIVVLSMIFGLFMLTILVYVVLALVLDEMPDSVEQHEQAPTAHMLLNRLEAELHGGENSLRDVERYVTSEAFSVRSRFRQL